MGRLRKPETFPQVFYTLLDTVLEQGSHEIPNLSKREAQRLRANIHAFRRSLLEFLPDVGHRYQSVFVQIKSPPSNIHTLTETDSRIYTLLLTDSNVGDEASIIAKSLGLDKLDPSPPTPEETETANTSATPAMDSSITDVLTSMRERERKDD